MPGEVASYFRYFTGNIVKKKLCTNSDRRMERMKIGVPKEIKNNENRVAMTPAGVVTLTSAGHQVLIEKGAGLSSSFTDEDYKQAGAIIVDTASEAWAAEMVMKV